MCIRDRLHAEGHILEYFDAHVCVGVVAVTWSLYSCIAEDLFVIITCRGRGREVIGVRARDDDLELVSILTRVCSSAHV